MPEHLQRQAPLLVWGGGSGGVAAALQAARSGASTLLLTPGAWLGGMVSAAGVCAPDGNELTPWQTGLWGALLRELSRREPGGLDHNWVSCFGYRPATAEAILRGWVASEKRLEWWPCCRILEVRRQGDRIQGLTVERGQGDAGRGGAGLWQLQVDLVIDGSDRGDLFPLAGAPFRFGWEAREQWQEPSAPAAEALAGEPFFREQPVQSPTWVVMGQLEEPPMPPAPPSAAANGAPSAGADGSRPELPEPFRGCCDRFGLDRTLLYGRLPGGAVMLNWPLQGNDWHQGLARAFDAPAAADFPAGSGERALAQEMRDHSLRFSRALQEASGGRLRPGALFPDAEAARQGALEGMESLALMPYWREGRRLVGLDLVIEQDLLPGGEGASIAPLPRGAHGESTAIAVGNYANDHHYPGEDWPLAPKSCRWGGRWSGTPFTIPYGALVSREVANLLAADKCLSVSHMANGATRLQPLILNIGQAAGLAAALCLREGLDPAELPVATLQRALISDPWAAAGPFPLWDIAWHRPDWAERQLAVLEDPDRLDRQGRLPDAPGGREPDGHRPPPEPGERLWSGLLRPDGQGGYRLEQEGGAWPLITLEPALNDWLLAQDTARPVRLIGCANPWGPWLRVSRLADG